MTTMPKDLLCLPTAKKVVPAGPDWIHEVKYDGYRPRVSARSAFATIAQVAPSGFPIRASSGSGPGCTPDCRLGPRYRSPSNGDRHGHRGSAEAPPDADQRRVQSR
jgi:hypothetical protein